MLALATSFLTALLALLIPNGSPLSRVWRPSFLFSAFSLFGLSITYSRYTFEGLHPTVIALYAAGVASFFLADFTTSTLLKKGVRLPTPEQFSLGKMVRAIPMVYVYLAITALGAVITLFVFRQRAGMFNMFEFGSALRYAEVNQLPTYGGPHLLLFGQAIASILVLNPRREMRLLGIAIYAVLVVATFVSLSRTAVFFVLSSLSFLLYVRRRTFRPLLFPVVAILALTFVYAIIRGQEGREESFFFAYAGYAIYAFNYFIFTSSQLDWGINSFGIVGQLIAGGLSPDDLSVGGTEYNVYSFMGSPYRDFGTAGVLLVPFLFGCIWSFVWNKVGHRPIYLLMYSWMIFPCIIPFFDWKFNFTIYLYLIPIYLVLITNRPFDEDNLQFGVSELGSR